MTSTNKEPRNEPIWPHEPTWYIHRLLIAYGLQSPDGWDEADWDEESIISALEDVIQHIVQPQDFIRSMRTLIKEDYEEKVAQEIADKNAMEAELEEDLLAQNYTAQEEWLEEDEDYEE